MRIRAVYFDANVYRDLLLSDGKYYHQLRHIQQSVDEGRLRVFASAKQFEESAGLLDKNRDAYAEIAGRALALSGQCILKDRSILLKLEITKQRQLSHLESCVSPELAAEFRRTVLDHGKALQIAHETQADHADYVDEFASAAVEVTEKLKTLRIGPSELREEMGSDWTISKELVDDWIWKGADFGPEGASDRQALGRWQIPILRSWYAYAIAHMYRASIKDTKVRSGDRGDWDHYAYAAVPGVLVTEDNRFHEIASHIALRYVRVMKSEIFFANLE